MAPLCEPGYVDVSSGNSYFWSCAFFCEGGPYYAQANCMCACLTAEQAAKADELGLIYKGPQPSLTTGSPGQVIVTSPPSLTTEPSDPVEKTPIGELNGDQAIAPPTVDGYIAPQATPVPSEKDDPGPETAGLSVTVLLVIVGALVCVMAVSLVGFAFWTGALKRNPTRVEDFKYVEPPVISLTGNETTFSGSRASSKQSATGSRGLGEVRTSSRRSSNASAAPSAHSLRDCANGAFYDSGTSSTTASQMLSFRQEAPACGPFHDVPRGGPLPDYVWAHKLEDDGRGLGGPRTSSRISAVSTNRLNPQELGSRRTSKASVNSVSSATQLLGAASTAPDAHHLGHDSHRLSPDRAVSRTSANHSPSDSRHLSPSIRPGSKSSAGTGRRGSKNSSAPSGDASRDGSREPESRRGSKRSTASGAEGRSLR